MTFEFDRSRKGGLGVDTFYEGEASTAFLYGVPCKFDANGKLSPIAAQTDRPQGIAKYPVTTTATGGETILLQDIGWTDSIWKAYIVPQLNGVTAQTGGSTTSVIVLSDQAYAAGAWIGGQVFIKELNMFATITASTVTTGSGQPMTLSFTTAYTASGGTRVNSGVPPFAALGQVLPKVPDGLTIYATPLGLNVAAAKFDAATLSTISQAIADKTGGYFQVLEVVLSAYSNPYVRGTFTT